MYDRNHYDKVNDFFMHSRGDNEYKKSSDERWTIMASWTGD